MICNYLSIARLDALDASKHKFNSAPRVEGSTCTFFQPSRELIDLTQEAVKKNPIPTNITIPPPPIFTPSANAWHNPFTSAFRPTTRYNDNNNTNNNDALTTTSGITPADATIQTFKTLQTQVTLLEEKLEKLQQNLDDASSARKIAEEELKAERERERNRDRQQREKEEEDHRAQRAKDEAEYKEQRERERKEEEEFNRAR